MSTRDDSAPNPSQVRPGRRWSARSRQLTRLGWALTSPALVVIIVLVLYPSVRSAAGSFQHYDLTSPGGGFSGVENYRKVLGSSDFQQSLISTAGYFVVLTVCCLVGGMVIAVWLQSLTSRWRAIALTIVILPWAVPGTVAGVLWSFILNPTSSGTLNSLLKSIGVISHYHVWLNSPVSGIIVIGLTLAWSSVPLGVIILLAGLEAIPRELYEQAQVDGSSTLRQYVSITLPLIRPAIAITLLNAAVLSIGIFDQIYVLVGLDPTKVSITGQIYLYAFRDFNFGFSFAASIIALLITGFVSLVYLRVVYHEYEM